jgi:recombinational DNA repair protein (RecF pathway)
MAKYHCDKCNKELEEVNFYKYRDGSYVELCKKCLTLHVDAFDPSTFTWLLQKLDVPYIPQEWNAVIENKMAKKPDKPLSHSAVFGSYLSKTKLKQWKDFYWADNEKIQEMYF